MLIGTKKGDKVQYGGAQMRVVSASDLNTLVVVSAEGEFYDAPIKDLEAEAAGATKPGIVVDTIRASKVDAYLEALGPLLSKFRNTKADVAAAAAKLDISVSAAYDAIRRFRESGRTALLPPPTRPGGRGKSRINANAQKIIEDVLETTVLKRGGTKGVPPCTHSCMNEVPSEMPISSFALLIGRGFAILISRLPTAPITGPPSRSG